jgi:hypothetical protein
VSQEPTRADGAPPGFAELAGEIGHELNNLLGVVGGRAELLRMYLDRGRVDEARAGVDVILGQVGRMRLISDRLRGLRRTAVLRDDVDVPALLAEAVGGAVPVVPRAGGDGLPLVRTDPELLREALGVPRAEAGSAAKGMRLAIGLDEAGANVEIEIALPDAPPDAMSRILSEVTRTLAPTPAGIRGGFADDVTTFWIVLPVA